MSIFSIITQNERFTQCIMTLRAFIRVGAKLNSFCPTLWFHTFFLNFEKKNWKQSRLSFTSNATLSFYGRQMPWGVKGHPEVIGASNGTMGFWGHQMAHWGYRGVKGHRASNGSNQRSWGVRGLGFKWPASKVRLSKVSGAKGLASL